MRTATRLTCAAATVAAVLPLLSACTLTVGTDSKPEASTASSAATTAATGSPTTESSTPTSSGTGEQTPAPQDATPSPPPVGATSEGAAPTTPGTSAMGARRRITVPPGHGIQSLELIRIYGADTASGSFGKAVGVFDVTTDRPLLIKLKLQLFDAAGNEIATNTGLNPSYVVGPHRLVTSNLIRLPANAKVASFKVSLVDTTDMKEPVFRTFEQPRLTTKNGVPALTGAFSYTGAPKTLDARGACVLPNGKVYAGQDGLNGNPTTQSGGATNGTYEIPIYDAKGVDLSQATCSASV